jgi:hypothetical protein
VPGVVPWQRWLSWSMLVLYTAVFLTGVLLLLPIRGQAYADLVQLHLLTSVWALPLTTWHAWHYRAGALPYLRRWARGLAHRRFWLGMALLLVPLPVLVADAAPVSQLSAVFGGSSWAPVGALRGRHLDSIARAPDGALVAAGDALYISHDGVVWLRVDLPTSDTPALSVGQPSASNQHARHQHSQAAPASPITALAVAPSQVFVGSAQSLFASSFAGPMQEVAFPGGGVRGLALDRPPPTFSGQPPPRARWLPRTAAKAGTGRRPGSPGPRTRPPSRILAETCSSATGPASSAGSRPCSPGCARLQRGPSRC